MPVRFYLSGRNARALIGDDFQQITPLTADMSLAPDRSQSMQTVASDQIVIAAGFRCQPRLSKRCWLFDRKWPYSKAWEEAPRAGRYPASSAAADELASISLICHYDGVSRPALILYPALSEQSGPVVGRESEGGAF